MNEIARELEEGHVVGIFPEGRLTSAGEGKSHQLSTNKLNYLNRYLESERSSDADLAILPA